jgi:hypothetical protein
MGRHSASGDDDEVEAATAAVEEAATQSGRHAVVEEHPEPRRRVPVEAAAPEPLEEAPQTARGNQSTAADLALLRAHSEVRARVIAALVVPFVLYTAVLFLIGRLGVYLIWVWIPLVGAGVVAGSILDAEHRKRAADRD